MARLLVLAALPILLGADWADLAPTKPMVDQPGSILFADQKRRFQDASLRESQAFDAVTTRQQWEAFRDPRIEALRKSLGPLPARTAMPNVVVTRELDGDGYQICNLLYESNPGVWVSANLYLPAKPPAKMPGILIATSHHTAKTNGELQDMGMTWARAGVAVLVPDALGYGERRQHRFTQESDYPKPYRVSRQDYYFRYNSHLELTTVGESLMTRLVGDLMRGVDVLLSLKGIDPQRIALLGSVAGGGDPAGVTAALDPRISTVVPFNFGGWQPESTRTERPDRDFPWFGDGYWESSRGLRNGARDGFAHWVIVGSIAPRNLLHSHEFAWDPKADPAWPRLQKVFGFYDASSHLRFAHGTGTLKGSPPESSHCTHIGQVHRKMIHPAFQEWLGLPIPEEYSRRRPSSDLICWTDDARQRLKPRDLASTLREEADRVITKAVSDYEKLPEMERTASLRATWTRVLGKTGPNLTPGVTTQAEETIPAGTVKRFVLETEPGIPVPVTLITPKGASARVPVALFVAQDGQAAYLKQRSAILEQFLKGGVAVALVDVRGTGETRVGTSASRGSSRTSLSQSEAMLGSSVIAKQLYDLRTVVRWVGSRPEIDAKRIGIWGESFAPTNPADRDPAAPLDAPDLPAVAEPGAPLLAMLAGLTDDAIKGIATRGSLESYRSLLQGPYLYVPHEVVMVGGVTTGDLPLLRRQLGDRLVDLGDRVNGINQRVNGPSLKPEAGATMLIQRLTQN